MLQAPSPLTSGEVSTPIFACAFGVPGIFTNFGFRVLHVSLNVLAGECDHLRVSSVEDLRATWPQDERKSVGITSEEPNAELAAYLIASGAPLVLFSSQPSEHLADFIRFGHDFQTAAHFASQRLTLLEPLRNASTSRVLHCPPAGSALSAFARQVVEGIGLRASRDQIAEIVQKLAPNDAGAEQATIEVVMEERSDPAQVLREKAPEAVALLRGVDKIVGCNTPGDRPWTGSIVWPSCVFRSPTNGNQPVHGEVKLVGGARPFILGPHYIIPPGHYSGTANFSLDRNVPANSFDIQVNCGDYTGGGLFFLPERGTFTAEFSLTVPDASSAVEIRFRLLEGAIDGIFTLHDVCLTRVARGGNSL